MNLGPMELILILGIVLLVFGGKKLPDLARSLGKSSSEFKKGMKDGEKDEDEEPETTTAPPALKSVSDEPPTS